MTLQRQHKRAPNRAGFTLMEMLVVVAIIVALAGLGGYYFLGQQKEAQKSLARTQLVTLTNACRTYATRHNGAFPGNLQMLLGNDEQGGEAILEREDALVDPWGQAYQYDQSGGKNGGRAPDIWTVVPNTNQMIGNWESKLKR